MKTQKVETVIIEPKDFMPLIQKAIDAVSGKSVTNIQFSCSAKRDEYGIMRTEDALQPTLTVSVLVEKEVE